MRDREREREREREKLERKRRWGLGIYIVKIEGNVCCFVVGNGHGRREGQSILAVFNGGGGVRS